MFCGVVDDKDPEKAADQRAKFITSVVTVKLEPQDEV
jgi:hypothetical protein